MQSVSKKAILLIALLLISIAPGISSEETNTEVNNESRFLPVNETYSLNGKNNHPQNPDYNSVNTDLSRIAPSAGNAEVDWISRSNNPSARAISNVLCSVETSPVDEQGLSDFNWIWGQFLSHDISFVLTQNGRVEVPERINIPIPEGDEWMDPYNIGSLLIPLHRSIFNQSTGTQNVPREFPNSITGWLDGSHVYGSSLNNSNWFRSFTDGKLKVSYGYNGDFLPIAPEDDENAPPVSFAGFSPSERYVAGDPRANEHAALTSLHVLFVREHNLLADEIKSENPHLNDEEIFHIARKINIAQMQYITYYEYLPSLGIDLPKYNGFDELVDPSVSNSFATLAFRMGHSQITNITKRLNANYEETRFGHISMKDGFWDPERLTYEGGIAPVFRGAAATTQAANDIFMVDDLRNSMFGDPGFGGLDMCAIDIQRGRDHGIPDYNTIRESFGLNKISNWTEITENQEVLQRLYQIYPDLSTVDPIMGMYAERHENNSVLGETMNSILTDQYQRLRDGDIFYFENDLELVPHMDRIMNTPLSKVIMRNTEITLMPCNLMYAVTITTDMDCFAPKTNEDPIEYNNKDEFTYRSTVVDSPVQFIDETASSGLSLNNNTSLFSWSAQGPTLSLGDCDSDGNDDLWVGSSYDHVNWETNQLASDSETYLFKGNGDGTFDDISLESGLKLYNSTILSASWIDYDNDGDLDIYYSNNGYSDIESGVQYSNVLYQNNGNCQFTDVTETTGLGNYGLSSTSTWSDYDNDGDLDLYSMNIGLIDQEYDRLTSQSDVFYKNQLIETGQAFFIDYTQEAGNIFGSNYWPEEQNTVVFGETIYYSVTAPENPSSASSVIKPQDWKGGEESDVSLGGTGVSWTALMVDLNGDGWDDLRLASDFGYSPLYINNQDGTFTLFDNRDSDIIMPGTAMGLDAGDYDGDMDLDICQSNFGPNYLFENNGDFIFEEMGEEIGLTIGYSGVSVTWDCNFIDVDLDGDLDLWFGAGNINPYSTYSPNMIYLNDGDGNFTIASMNMSKLFHPTGKTMGSIWSDFDKDGDLDVIISESNTGLQYFSNNAADNLSNQWIAIDVWEKSTHQTNFTIADGAIVDIYLSNDKTIRQVVKLGSGYAGTKDTTINLGIPDNEVIDKIGITWKDGTYQEYFDLEVNQYHSFEAVTVYNVQELTSSSEESNVLALGLIVSLTLFVAMYLILRKPE